MKSLLPVKCVPEKESWRLGLLDALLHERGVLEKESGIDEILDLEKI